MSIVARPSRGTVRSGVMVKRQKASSTITWATVTGSGPPLTMVNVMCPGVSRARSTVSSSTGGTPRDSVERSPPRVTSSASAASKASGKTRSRRHPLVAHLEQPHPAQLRELGLMRVEHERAGSVVGELQDVALPLAHADRIREFGRHERGAGAVYVEEVAMDVDRVDQIEFEQVRE